MSFRLPEPLRSLLQRLPEAPPACVLASLVNLALAAGVLPRAQLEALRGKRLRIEERASGLGVTLAYTPAGFRPGGSGAADVTIRAGIEDYAALALRREDPDTLFFMRRLVIEGDTDLGLILKNALDALDAQRLPAPLRALLRFAQPS